MVTGIPGHTGNDVLIVISISGPHARIIILSSAMSLPIPPVALFRIEKAIEVWPGAVLKVKPYVFHVASFIIFPVFKATFPSSMKSTFGRME